MTKATISEYVRMTQASGPGNTVVQCPEEPPVAVQQVDYTAGVTASAAFNVKTRFVRVHNDSICAFRFGAAPTALVTDPRKIAGQTEYHGIAGDGSAAKVSFITTT